MQSLPISLYQGDDWASLITVNNCDGSPFDLTNYTAQGQIRQGPADQNWWISATFTCAIVPVQSGQTPNQISISLTNAQTALLRNLNYVWDLQVTSPDGIITTVVGGTVSVTPEVTRTTPQTWPPSAVRAFEAAWRRMVA
jgi:hypothetical protein